MLVYEVELFIDKMPAFIEKWDKITHPNVHKLPVLILFF